MKRHAESARLAVQEAAAPPSALAAAEDCQVALDAAVLGCACPFLRVWLQYSAHNLSRFTSHT